MLSSIRILVADDFEDWRRQVVLLVQARPEWRVIAEASDGLEAIQKAEEFKPELIVLDVGLPNLNGIEAARQIQQLSPSSKIIFLSQNNDLDIVRAALRTGAQGYICKTKVRRDFWPAVEAVLRGKQFVSGGLKIDELTDSSGEKAAYRHEVLFYSDDRILLDRLSRFVGAALDAGKAAVVLATKAHSDGVLQRLKAGGVDIAAALQQGTYIPLDAKNILSTVMVNDLPNPTRFFQGLGSFIEAAARSTRSERPRVVAFGEAVNLLQAQGKPDAAIRLEQLWNDLGNTFGVDILCGYALSSFHGEKNERVFQSICAEHSAVCSE